MDVRTFFFDTYAFHEIIVSNPNYKMYERAGIITTKLNLMELHYSILLKYGKETADDYYNKLVQFAIEIDDEIIKEASNFRCINKRNKLSYVDCIGYIISRKLGVKFLTGDNGFKNMENVEFVK